MWREVEEGRDEARQRARRNNDKQWDFGGLGWGLWNDAVNGLIGFMEYWVLFQYIETHNVYRHLLIKTCKMKSAPFLYQ